MTLKRSPNLEDNRGIKRRRTTVSTTPSTPNDTTNMECSTCVRETGYTNSDCINVDLTPSTYFRLAVLIGDPTEAGLLQKDEDETIKLLASYAHQLAVESELTLNAILMLYPLLSNYNEQGLSKLISVVKKTRLHQARELKFINSCLGNVKSSTIALVKSQFESGIKERIDLNKIMLSDIRYARLFPLLCYLKDASTAPVDNIISIDQDDSQDITTQDYLQASNNYEIIQDSDNELLDSSELIIDMTQDSHAFVLAPSVPDNSSYHFQSSSLAEQEEIYNFDSEAGATDLFGSRHSSQSVDRNASFYAPLNLPSPVSKNSSTISLPILDSQSELPISQSHVSTSSTSLPNIGDSQKNIPEYEELTTAELKAKVSSYGFKKSNNRAKMITDLQNVFASISSQTNSQQACIQSTSAQELPESSSSQTGSLDPNKRKEIITHLKSNPEIWKKIAMYNTVSIDECIVGINCKRREMKMVLDEFAAAKGTNKRYQSKN